jgi:imidazolonepropionase-like amidohydrolase
MTPMDAIRSATLIGAMTIGHAKDMGTIGAGKLANLVFVAKNPLDDIANLKSVVLTVKRGVPYRRSDYRPIQKDEVRDNQ